MSLSKLISRAKYKIAWHRDAIKRSRRVWKETRHLFGPKTITLGEHEVAAVCMLKDAAYYIGELLRHHRELGVSHFVFIDNGSTDGTLDELRREPDVTIYENHLSVGEYECEMRSHAAQRAVRGGWFLFIDSDELLELPDALGRPVDFYTRYCNKKGYNLVVSQMLDLFSPNSLAETKKWSYAKAIRRFDTYCLEHVRTMDYHDPDGPFYNHLLLNKVSDSNIKLLFGGIRSEIFSENCALTKHSLVKNRPDTKIYVHPHCSSAGHCADFSVLIRHYKFAGDYLEREHREIAAGVWEHGENVKRAQVITGPNFVLSSAHARRLLSVDQLVSEGFLIRPLALSGASATGVRVIFG